MRYTSILNSFETFRPFPSLLNDQCLLVTCWSNVVFYNAIFLNNAFDENNKQWNKKMPNIPTKVDL